jgi:gliding motility-associated-like protein
MIAKAFQLLTFLLFSLHLNAQVDTLYVCEPGDEIQLEVEEGAFAYLWTSASSLSNPRIHNPIAKPYVETTYIAEILSAQQSENLVVNPDFSLGNVGFTSDYMYDRIIVAQGVYGVDFSPADLNGVHFSRCADHTDGQGMMMVVDGSPRNNQKVWCQSIAVKPDTDYVFTCWLSSARAGNPAQLKFSVNGEALGNVLKAPDEVCIWTQFYGLWNSGSVDSAEICIINTNVNPNGNDFSLDDFSFYELEKIQHDTTVVLIEGLIEAKNRRVFVPSAFSPNNDRFNDRLEVFLGKGTEFMKEYAIFDAWGNKVFENINCVFIEDSCFWDGTINGDPAKPGTYVYIVKVLFTDKEIHQFTGSVELLR